MANTVREARQQRRLDRRNHRNYRRMVRKGKFQPLQLADYDIQFTPQVKPVVLEELPIQHWNEEGKPLGKWTRESEFTSPPKGLEISMHPDDFAFGDVFNWYRAHLENPGPNTTFKWRGKTYTTETLAEKQAREAAERAKKEQEEKNAKLLVSRYAGEFLGQEGAVNPSGNVYLPTSISDEKISEEDIYRYTWPERFAGNDSIPVDTIIARIPTNLEYSSLGKQIYNVADSLDLNRADTLYSNNDSLNYATVIPYFKALPDTVWFNDSIGIPKLVILKDKAGISLAIQPIKMIRVLSERQGGKFPIFRNGGKIN